MTRSCVERAEIIRDKGTNRKQFFRGLVDKYTWVDLGSSYVPSEICSAFLYAQLEMMATITQSRRRKFEFYLDEMSPLEEKDYSDFLGCPKIAKAIIIFFIYYYLIKMPGTS